MEQPRDRRARDAGGDRGRRAPRLLSGAAAGAWEIRDPRVRGVAAGAAILRRRLRLGAAVRPRRDRHPCPAEHRDLPGLDLRYAGARLGLYTHAIPICTLADARGLEGGGCLDRGSRPEPRRLALARVLDRDPAGGDPVRALGRALGLHGDAGEFRRALRAGGGQADPRRRCLQTLRRRGRRQLGVGGRARDTTGRAPDGGAAAPAPLPGPAPPPPPRPPRTPGPPRRPPAAAAPPRV